MAMVTASVDRLDQIPPRLAFLFDPDPFARARRTGGAQRNACGWCAGGGGSRWPKSLPLGRASTASVSGAVASQVKARDRAERQGALSSDPLSR